MELDDLPNPIKFAIRKNKLKEEQIKKLTPKEAFRVYMKWHGLDTWVDEIYEIMMKLSKLEKS